MFMQFIDSHTHVHFDKFADRAKLVLDAAERAGVFKIINVGVDLPDSKKAVEFANKFQNAWASIGVHPHEAEAFDDYELFSELIKQPKVVAIGEIGLDYFKLYSEKEPQIEIFKKQIEASVDSGLPYIFHVRDAWEDFFKIVDEFKGIRGVVHSFTSNTKNLDEVLKRGFYVGLNGIMTFTKDESQLEAAKKVPLDRLVLETDAPFLAPAPKRGQVCEPKDLVLTAQFLSELRGESLDKIANATTKNCEELFNLK